MESPATPESPSVRPSAKPAQRPSLRIAFATGTSPEKWFRRFRSRIPADLETQSLDTPMTALESSAADMALVRLTSAEELPESLHRIKLYDEAWGVAFEKEHVFSVADRVPEELLAEETVLLTSTDVAEIRQMLPVAATGAGVVVGPRTILKALSKKAVTSADLVAGDGIGEAAEAADVGPEPLSKTSVWLVWPKSEDDELRQEFVGIVQGRREGSTRSQLGARRGPGQSSSQGGAEKPAGKKLSAREKTLAKQARRGQGTGVGKQVRGGGPARGSRRGRGGSGRGSSGGSRVRRK